MGLTADEKIDIIKQYGDIKNTGSTQVQISLLTARIQSITKHLQRFKKDKHTCHGLTKIVSQRRRLMKYFKRKNISEYQKLIAALDIRG